MAAAGLPPCKAGCRMQGDAGGFKVTQGLHPPTSLCIPMNPPAHPASPCISSASPLHPPASSMHPLAPHCIPFHPLVSPSTPCTLICLFVWVSFLFVCLFVGAYLHTCLLAYLHTWDTWILEYLGHLDTCKLAHLHTWDTWIHAYLHTWVSWILAYLGVG